MPLPRITLFPLTPTAFRRWGGFVLGSGLALGLLIVVFLTWKAPAVLPFFPFLLLGGAGAWYLFQRPLLNLCVLLGGFVLISDYQEGLQITEILYGLYYLGFMGYWFLVRLLREERVLHTVEEKALLLFLVLITASFPLTILFGGSLRGAFSEWIALAMLALYFPVRAACTEYRNGVKIILLVMAGVGLAIVLRNLLNYQAILVSASQAWEVVKGRVATNDNALMAASLISLVFLLFAQQWKSRVLLLGGFFLFFTGLILTQSRGYWISFALGVLVMFLLVDRRYKARIIILGIGGAVGTLGLGAIFLGDFLFLVLGGLLDRLTSLGSATTKDISLVNRFAETVAVWQHVKVNPVIGHGMGVEYGFFDLIFDFTRRKAFVHNGYMALWFKFGLWGLGLMVFVWVRSAWRGAQVFRLAHADRLYKMAGLGVAISLTAFMLSSITANPFFLNDTTYLFGLLMGLAGGLYQRALLEQPTPEGNDAV